MYYRFPATPVKKPNVANVDSQPDIRRMSTKKKNVAHSSQWPYPVP